MAADGRGLQSTHINENFAKLAESLYIADRKAREAVEMRAQVEKKIANKEKVILCFLSQNYVTIIYSDTKKHNVSLKGLTVCKLPVDLIQKYLAYTLVICVAYSK